MIITYNDTKKDLPVEQLHHLFFLAGWAGSEITPDPEILKKFNIPFINSTLVISAWENERLIGAVRVLSDMFIRSVIYDLVIDPEYQNKGIGKELVKRCIEHFPNCEWLVQTEKHISGYYEKIGFKIYNDVVLTIPSIYQRTE
ncbi:GNAT family N-acetyltransferase [Mobilitalea sibirica]|uniref:GNAT family N-acetyltransferase n=1 Tax=Mobilitalea sibirica TaxID=1462919 RepID=A0A8J7KVR0_9FIRM|nr:GNAT family N-acetyltransferase [Mobilitalea sibirica]MBH1939462.1 GNAT family N-acetyltransferase [Mobilitalea sibirica]